MVNIMMCAEDNDNYQSEPTLDECFFEQKKSQNIIEALKPNKIVLSGGTAIKFFCKEPFGSQSLYRLRTDRSNRWNKIRSSKGEAGLKEVEFQKIGRFNIKNEIKKIFPDSDFYWIGHYAARGIKFDEAIEDAEIFSYTSL